MEQDSEVDYVHCAKYMEYTPALSEEDVFLVSRADRKRPRDDDNDNDRLDRKRPRDDDDDNDRLDPRDFIYVHHDAEEAFNTCNKLAKENGLPLLDHFKSPFRSDFRGDAIGMEIFPHKPHFRNAAQANAARGGYLDACKKLLKRARDADDKDVFFSPESGWLYVRRKTSWRIMTAGRKTSMDSVKTKWRLNFVTIHNNENAANHVVVNRSNFHPIRLIRQ